MLTNLILQDKVWLVLKTPAIINIKGITKESLELLVKTLTFENTAAKFLYNKFTKNQRSRFIKNYETIKEELAAKQTYSLVEVDGDEGAIYSGYKDLLLSIFPNATFVCNVDYVENSYIPWLSKPFDLRDYQEQCVSKLMDVKHGAISLATSLGKSRIIAELVKRHGLQTVIMVPTSSIATQLYNDFERWFGKRYVGMLGDGQRKFDKKVTIGIAASLSNAEPGNEVWEALHSAKVFIVDESHTIAAATFKKVAMGLLANCPYRYFVSGTQHRGDGTEPILNGIIGNIIYTMSASDGISKGWLPKPKFCVIKTQQDVVCKDFDPDVITRKVFYGSPTINKRIGTIVDKAVESGNAPVLILVDDIAQFTNVIPYIKHKVAFAHGTLDKKHKKKISKEHWSDDTTDLVERFNNGEFPVMIGTSAIGMGTNTIPVKTLIYFKGGKSFVSVSQGIGRGFRMCEGKTSFLVFDFDVEDNFILHKHLTERVDIYRSIYDNVKYYV
jgi:superfamily II DNA or RNA helicase